MENTNLINEIINAAEVGNYFNRRDVSIQSFGLGEKTINFINENRELFYSNISKIYSSDANIKDTYTISKFQQEFISFFHEKIIPNLTISDQDTHGFFKKLKSAPLVNYSVFRDIHGIRIDSDDGIVKLGEFKIYDFGKQKENIESRSKCAPEHIWHSQHPNYLIEYNADARHYEKAIEISDSYFERFELFLRYIIGNLDSKFEVGVLTYQGWRNRKAYVFSSNGGISSSTKRHGSYETIPIDNEYFNNNEFGNSYAWSLACSKGLNAFQKRLVLAIEWIGQAMADTSYQSGFIKAAISLEIIFSYSEKSIVTPSIMNQISESIALILGNTADERIKIEGEVKKLYSIRSAIVHSGNKDINQSDFYKMLYLSRDVIQFFLTSSKLKSITSVEGLYALLKQTKYSCEKI